uniref:Iron-sulfur cluster formation ABC transporterATP-binding subunit n=1 Tax=Alsidium seaforthii TaxID=2007182 RepID=A0A1Z1MD38_9FLOR|nr:Iron-sulfur cluster formation ABC transporterATP-binding subunit [Bryothamnion seaforthii]ARW63930.1 Iron-sulfur cluster formation ABC transporterATP-binding subunit [Bryothamnion seaforthii]
MKNPSILEIKDLSVSIKEEKIINNLNLSIKTGEIHVIMGKNGSGKSTLAKVIAGHPAYKIIQGKIIFNNQDITNEDPEIRSHMGIFLAFQYPIEIPGVSNIDFLRIIYNSKQKAKNQKELDPLSFFELINNKLKEINMDTSFLNRHVNEGFSGGEKKKNEILQMSLLNSKLSILDEIDSGLDVDALKSVAHNINCFANSTNSILIITHYQKLIDYIKPNYVHVMKEGKIIYTGDSDTAAKIEEHGYDHIRNINKSIADLT